MLTITRTFADDDLLVVAHVVHTHPLVPQETDPLKVAQAWIEHAADHVGLLACDAKIEKYRTAYEQERTALGDSYKSAVTKRLEQEADKQAQVEADAASAKMAEEARFKAAVADAVARLKQ